MFTKDAIQELAQAQAIAAATDAIERNDVDVFALPDNFKIHDPEGYQARRRRMRGTMKTSSAKNFADYTVDHSEEGSSVFVDANNMQAVAVLNLGTTNSPGHCDNRAVFVPPKTSAFEALLSMASGSQKRQSDVAEYLEDWANHVRCENEAGQEIPVKHAVAAVRKITIEGTRRQENSEGQLSASRSTFEQVQAKGADNLPVVIDFTCEPYLGLKTRTFRARISILTTDKPALILRIAKKQQHEEEMANELANLIEQHMRESEADFASERIPVLLGEYAAKS
jgi:uncharacterized protein YfdQ (DUF2303 family)